MRYFFFCFLSIFLLLNSCGNEKKSSSISAEKDSLRLVESELDSTTLKDAPDWFKDVPESDSVIYAAATAKSSRANIARDKAIMKAQVELAEIVKTGGSPKGADSGDQFSVELDAMLKNVVTSKQFQVQEGKLWRVYVLLEMKK